MTTLRAHAARVAAVLILTALVAVPVVLLGHGCAP